MALAIRLTRGGAKKRPYYRIVVADSRAPRDGRFIEKLGTYNPLLAKDSPERVTLDADRISHWLSVGAQPSTEGESAQEPAEGADEAAPSTDGSPEPAEAAAESGESNEAPAEGAAEQAE